MSKFHSGALEDPEINRSQNPLRFKVTICTQQDQVPVNTQSLNE